MTTPSLYSSTGMSILAYKPTIVAATSYNPRGLLVDDRLAEKASSGDYSHEIQALGGWWSAKLDLLLSRDELEDWLENGLNRHIEVYSPDLDRIFEGFVNQVDAQIGTLSVTRGPLLDIANRLSVTYTPIIDPTTVPPVMGTQTTTTIVQDTASQTLYGTVEKVISGGECLDDNTTDEAAQIRDTALAEMNLPETTEQVAFESSSEPRVSLSILGYVHRMNAYIVQDLTAATIQLDTKLQNTVAAQPEALFSTDYSKVAANAWLASRYENDNRTAWAIVQALVAIGDSSDNRYTFGIYEDRKAYYAAAPTTAAYQHRIGDTRKEMQTIGGDLVRPWNVLPARWVFFPDFLTGMPPATDLRTDPRYLFIERVSFKAPNTIQLSGNKFGRLAQLLAKKGAGA